MVKLAFTDEGTKIDRSRRQFGYEWLKLTDDDFEDLVTTIHVAAQSMIDDGFGEQLLCAVFGFEPGNVRFIYNFKRGTFYPFVPLAKQAARLRARAAAAGQARAGAARSSPSSSAGTRSGTPRSDPTGGGSAALGGRDARRSPLDLCGCRASVGRTRRGTTGAGMAATPAGRASSPLRSNARGRCPSLEMTVGGDDMCHLEFLDTLATPRHPCVTSAAGTLFDVMYALPTLYKARNLPVKRPVCAICVERTRGRTEEVRLGYRVTVWLCPGHAAHANFRHSRGGRDFVRTLWGVWQANGCTTRPGTERLTRTSPACARPRPAHAAGKLLVARAAAPPRSPLRTGEAARAPRAARVIRTAHVAPPTPPAAARCSGGTPSAAGSRARRRPSAAPRRRGPFTSSFPGLNASALALPAAAHAERSRTHHAARTRHAQASSAARAPA